MKGVIILLVGLTLMLGSGTALAAAGANVGSSVAISAEQADPLLAAPCGSDTLSPEAYPSAKTDADKGRHDSRALTVWDYVVSPQVTINLECRPFTAEENGLALVSDGVDVKQITQNFMLGFHYKF